MLRNYLKISLAVLLRRKFLTFVNLFGAVLTLTVLVVAFAIFESIVSPPGAQHRQEQILAVNRVMLRGERMVQTSGVGMRLYEGYIEPLETPDKVSFATRPTASTSYLDGRRVTSFIRRTDAAYWEILDFDVLEGRTLSADDIEQGRFVAVINKATAAIWFPDQSPIGGKVIADSESFEVIGIVANEPETNELAYSDIWVPITANPSYAQSWIGNGQAMLFVEDPSERELVDDELQQALEDFVYADDPTRIDRAYALAQTPFERLASEIYTDIVGYDDDEFTNDRSPEFIALVTLVVLLFMALPAMNMANLNIGRILERSSEIGLRKAAGASQRALTGQFIFENVVLCCLGGLVALAITPLVLGYLNETLFVYGRLTLNLPIFLAGFVFVLVFGLVSGAYPAWKMAKLEPASALRGRQRV